MCASISFSSDQTFLKNKMTNSNFPISANEDYMNNAASLVFSNFRKAAKRKQNSVWAHGITLPDEEMFEQRSEIQQVVKTFGKARKDYLSQNSKIPPYKVHNAKINDDKLHSPLLRNKWDGIENNRQSSTAKNSASNECKGGIWNLNPDHTQTELVQGLEYKTEKVPESIENNGQSSTAINAASNECRSGIWNLNPDHTQTELIQGLEYKSESEKVLESIENNGQSSIAKTAASNECGIGIWNLNPDYAQIELFQGLELKYKTEKSQNVSESVENNELSTAKNAASSECRGGIWNLSPDHTQTEFVHGLKYKTVESEKVAELHTPTAQKTTFGIQQRKDATYKKVKLHSLSVDDISSVKSEKSATKKRTNKDFGNNLICIKVVKGKQFCEFVTNPTALLRVKKKFPKLLDVIPSVDARQKEINWSADTVKVIMKYLFNPPLNYDSLLNGRTVVETLVAAGKWEIDDFRRQLQTHFIQTFLNEKSLKKFHSIANYLGDHELCNVIQNSSKDGGSLNNDTVVKYTQKTCFVSCQTYAEPLEFPIPLTSGEQVYVDNFSKDITNEITFEAISGCFAITGFQMSFLVDTSKIKEASKLKIYYNLLNMSDNSSMGDQKEKLLGPTVIIYFKTDFIVKAHQKCKITVETEVKPCLCFISEEDVIRHKSTNAEFILTLSSTIKIKQLNKSRFLIDKLFLRKQNCTAPITGKAVSNESGNEICNLNQDLSLQSPTSEKCPQNEVLHIPIMGEKTTFELQRKISNFGGKCRDIKDENKNSFSKKIRQDSGLFDNNSKVFDKTSGRQNNIVNKHMKLQDNANEHSVQRKQKSVAYKKVKLHSISVDNISGMNLTTVNFERLSAKQQNYAEETNKDFEHSLICIKVSKDKQYFEFTTNPTALLRVKNKFPKLLEVIPSVDAMNKEINWSADAMNMILKYLFDQPVNFTTFSNGRTVIEALAAAEKWEINAFRKELWSHFLQKFFDDKSSKELYSLANHFNDHEICEAIKKASKDGSSLNKDTVVRYKQKTCFVSCQTYTESLEFFIPLTSGETVYGDNFSKDIRNEITFEAISGCFAITGFQMSFDVDMNEILDSSKLKIYYNLSNSSENSSMEDEKEKPLRSTVIIHFKKDFIVKTRQTCKITVETEIKPYLCFVSQEDIINHKSNGAEFNVILASTFKVKRLNKNRFLIEKLFFREMKDFI